MAESITPSGASELSQPGPPVAAGGREGDSEGGGSRGSPVHHSTPVTVFSAALRRLLLGRCVAQRPVRCRGRSFAFTFFATELAIRTVVWK